MDPQRQRVYDAERAAFLPMPGARDGHRFVVELPELADLQRFLDFVRTSRWFRRTFGNQYYDMRAQDGRGQIHSAANAGHRTVSVKRAYRCRWIVLHEVAHVLTPAGCQKHGPEYVKIYLQLVRHYLGRAAWRALYDQCKLHRVKMQTRKRARRPLTPEQRAVLIDRLREARERKQERDQHIAYLEGQAP